MLRELVRSVLRFEGVGRGLAAVTMRSTCAFIVTMASWLVAHRGSVVCLVGGRRLVMLVHVVRTLWTHLVTVRCTFLGATFVVLVDTFGLQYERFVGRNAASLRGM